MLAKLFALNPYLWSLFIVLLLVWWNYPRRKLYRLSWQLPGPNPALPIIGNLLQMIGRTPIYQIISVLSDNASKYKSGIYRLWLGTTLCIFINDPSVAYQVNQKTQLKSDEYQYLVKPLIARGIFQTNDMPYWRHVKKAYLVGLSNENLKSFVPVFHQEAFRTLDVFRQYARNEKSVFTPMIFGKYVLGCLAKCTLDFDTHTKEEEQTERLILCYQNSLEVFQQRVLYPVLRNETLFALSGIKAKEWKIVNGSVGYIHDIIKNYRKNKANNASIKVAVEESFIECLMEDKTLSDDDLVGHIITMIVAGTDTLVTEYTLLLVLLAQNPDIQDKVYAELVDTLGDDITVCPTPEELNNLEYLDRVIKEGLRMFPAAPTIARKVPEDFTVVLSDGKTYTIPVGTTIFILIQNILNNPTYYENPQVMDPDRWLPDEVAKRPPYSYLPFSNGPRNCPGGRYGILQMKTMLSMVLRSFEICTSKSCETYADICTLMTMTLKIGEHCEVMFRERKRKAC